ncbi:MAG: hypothetical protein ACE5MK_01575, partial [Acidobacteriota bacterium]
MCYFITVGIAEKFESVFKQRMRPEFGIDRSSNTSILHNLDPADVAFEVITGMCSCDLFTQPRDLEKEAERLRHKYSKPKYKKRG